MQRKLDKKKDTKEIKENYEIMEESPYRQYFHIEPISGKLNDPNGFAYHEGEWVLFYQWDPFGPENSPKHWYKLKSKDLVYFENSGTGLIPDETYENQGAYSGTGLSIGGDLNVFYTGNYRDEKNTRKPKQVRGILSDDGLIKEKTIIIPTNQVFTEHQRDPSIYYNEKDKYYYIFLGCQTLDLKGAICLYKSKDLNKWEYLGLLKIKGYEDFGYMWECPSFARVDGKDLLIFSPQGVDLKKYGFSNKDNNGYLIGKMDFSKLEFIPEGDFSLLDHGFEFYASQIASKDNKAYLISWLGLPDLDLKIGQTRYSSLSLVRELSIKNGKLFQEPMNFDKYKLKEENLSRKVLKLENIRPMVLSLDKIKEDLQIKIYSGEKDRGGLVLKYKEGKLSLDRTSLDHVINENDTNIREIRTFLSKLQIFIDKSTVEIFVNDGEYALTTRIFPSENEKNLEINSKSKIDIKYSKIEKLDKNFVI